MFGIIFGSGPLTSSLIVFGIIFALCIPLFIVFTIQEKRNRNRMIVVQMNTPRGPAKGAVKIGFSWTIFFFWKWALLFRSQWMEFFIWIFVGMGFAILLGIVTQPAAQAGIDAYVAHAVSLGKPEITAGMSIGQMNNFLSPAEKIDCNKAYSTAYNEALKVIGWTFYVSISAKIIADVLLIYWFTLFGNKMRLKKLYAKGAIIDMPENDNVADIYAYIGVEPSAAVRGNTVAPKPGVVQGQSHQYVVPDSQVTEPEETYDYSMLTPQDLKLLLKSEGIPFDASSSKEELLELVEENIAKAQRAEAEKEKKQYSDSKYFMMTVQELVEELDKKEIKYTSTMKKADLVKLLVDSENKK